MPSDTTVPGQLSGVVCRAHGDLCDVALLSSDTEQHWLCSLRGKLKRQAQAVTSLVAVGDEVLFTVLNHEQGVIESVGKRRSRLSRVSTTPGKVTEQILAVNIDYSIIVMACHAPDYNPRRLDWHLTAALAGDLSPVIILSKVDLPQAQAAKEDIARYRLLGYPVIATSTKTGEGLSELSDLLAHKKAVLVGSSGVGKTTLCSLIPRFYEATGGKILIDGKELSEFTLRSLRRHIGVVQQDVYLFIGTVKENIRYGKPDASDEEIVEAAKNANAHEFIKELPGGYDAYIGQRGIKLSGGQKQRISIARVFLKNPAILIFDEATSSLDNESEKVVQDSFERLARDRTTFVIAHRLSTIRNAGRIIVLNEDGVAEEGSHGELLEADGVYARFYRMQFF